jgi:hypothetical protein
MKEQFVAPRLTVCLTSWKRPENISIILDALKRQTERPTIFLWNNGKHIEPTRACDWVVNSSRNMLCWPRWLMLSMAETEYVCVMDDDISLTDSNVLRDAVRVAATMPETTVCGPTGVRLVEDRPYKDGIHLASYRHHTDADTACDIVKGTFMLLRAEQLRKHVPLKHPAAYREDDIAVCGLLAGGRRGDHRCLTSFGGRFLALPSPHSLWRQPGHFERRDAASREFFSEVRAAPTPTSRPSSPAAPQASPVRR